MLSGGTGTESDSVEMPSGGASRVVANSQYVIASDGLNATLTRLNETVRNAINSKIAELTSCLVGAHAGVPGADLLLPTDKTRHFGVVSTVVDDVELQALEIVEDARVDGYAG